MKFIKTISFLSVMTVAVSSVSYGVPMTPQIRNLLEEKEEKIKALEQCDGKRKGWMIAGISTIGLTAVGVGVNIAQSSKSNKLSDQIDNANQELQRHETHLGQIQSQISEKEREKAEVEKAAREEEERLRAKQKVGDQSGKGEDDSGDSDETYIETQENSIPEPDTTATTVKGNEINKQTSETGGRVIGDKCNSEDIKKLKPYGWVSGTYIRVGEKVKTTLGARCETKKGAGDNVNCSCRADECDTDKNFERDANGLCVKQQAEQKKEEEKKEEPKSKEKDLDASVKGTGYGYYDIDGDVKSDVDCSVSTAGEWCAVFPKYTVKGKAVCNNTDGTYAKSSSSEQKNSADGKVCWCKMINPKESSWVSNLSYYNSANCVSLCAYDCASAVAYESVLRGSVFGSAK